MFMYRFSKKHYFKLVFYNLVKVDLIKFEFYLHLGLIENSFYFYTNRKIEFYYIKLYFGDE